MSKKPHKREISGKVVKVSGNKTVKILVERRVLHPKYHKIVRRFKNYLIHDEKGAAKIGDIITAVECRPLSKNKHFRLQSVHKGESA